MKYTLKYLIILLSTLTLVSCSEHSAKKQSIHEAVAIEAADECHLCGMLISEFPGPKGELFKNGISQDEGNKVHKFCSTRDMFSFYLDPENKRNITTILVHDMSKSPWNNPNDEYFIDARSAWFVTGSTQKGAMGATLASFSTKTDAQAFADEFNGHVLAFNEITLATLMPAH
ncbi:nitrous oxide reductase accessory protein NosL [Thalassotalea profundi]|uniref:Nitrous oxide reductase accessory protein NosL n=1 Tax=Thalassotalea profundi TaxID=2036687 RepID=A0ABQ3IPF2_9GAMM|nr:nitrous oxide reductase accessory protein NosL [Thalassotalea profundi]GHE86317.1 nitrous oxide reductase accessory protein NosL [Thalassotalea profundi]